MEFYNKLKWVLGILMVFVLIIATNLIDKNNFVRVRDSVVSIYEDRLIAKNLIFEMLKSVHQKELAISLSDATFFKTQNLQVNKNLQGLISNFEETKLTVEESNVFNDFKNNIQALLDAEDKFLKSDFDDNSQVISHLESVKNNLNDLSKIQLTEGSRHMLISRRALDTVELFTQIEIYFLVVLAIIIQILVIYTPKEKA